jgi:hypothetical protein
MDNRRRTVIARVPGRSQCPRWRARRSNSPPPSRSFRPCREGSRTVPRTDPGASRSATAVAHLIAGSDTVGPHPQPAASEALRAAGRHARGNPPERSTVGGRGTLAEGLTVGSRGRFGGGGGVWSWEPQGRGLTVGSRTVLGGVDDVLITTLRRGCTGCWSEVLRAVGDAHLRGAREGGREVLLRGLATGW